MDKSAKFLILFCSIIFLVHLNYFHLDIMEARNFVTAREMVDDGNWILTTINGQPRYQKPPLPTWMSAATGSLFGMQKAWALRLPVAFFSIAIVWFLYKFVRRETGDKATGIISGLIFTTAFLVIFQGKRASWDVYSYAFAFVGIWYLYLTFKSEKVKWENFLWAGILLGCSFLSKGPTAIYVVAAPFFLAWWIAYGFPKIRWGGWILMGGVALVIGLSWYGYVYVHDQETLLSILKEESEARGNRDVKSPARYLSFPVQMGVWAIISVVALIFPYVRKKTKFKKAYTFFFWWTLICLVLLSLVPSKKERYLFPLLIPLSATAGIYVQSFIERRTLPNWEKVILKFSFGLAAVVGILLPIGLFVFMKATPDFYSIAFSVVLFVLGIYLFIKTFFDFDLKKCFNTTVIFMGAAVVLGSPVVDSFFSGNPEYHSILERKQELTDSGLTLYELNGYLPEIWFKYREIIPDIWTDDPGSWPEEEEFYLIADRSFTPEGVVNRMKEMGYEAEFLERFDENEEPPEAANYKNRKILFLFKVRKAE